jgi:hypothetical protein
MARPRQPENSRRGDVSIGDLQPKAASRDYGKFTPLQSEARPAFYWKSTPLLGANILMRFFHR